ncbi:2OG-Fe dioxygenase family protein [Anabaena subtropica]|uniref:2OG-Fe dioxygenase family protein n=1 Tax=Anabaena subtropica FACHB-260 TaxID=2692884 RepID=A0ABR8CJM2_9NOST|nr:2OG-Fe dioxygenase family protein [Anabaena subtropica]MBD2343054.1 2OG-Fe dioxygenase family protein [Anabaena subtropica FACHB-260]
MQTVGGMTELEYAFLFALKKVNSLELGDFQPFYNNLPVDPYIKGNYRRRRLSRFIVTGNQLIKLPHGYLFQSKDYNPLLGDVKREFAELDDALIELDSFRSLVLAFSDSCKLHPEAEIGVHQIRTTCSPESFGNPAPEGIHQDGTDFIGIFSVDRDNIQGGETHLYTAKKEKPVLSKILYPGELLLVNDHDFYHFTTPIKPQIATQGIRDVFVLTSPSLLTD